MLFRSVEESRGQGPFAVRGSDDAESKCFKRGEAVEAVREKVPRRCLRLLEDEVAHARRDEVKDGQEPLLRQSAGLGVV